MNDKPVVSVQQRDALFGKLREDPQFRELIKKDWREAFKVAHIDPETVVKGTLSRREVENFINQRAGWTIEIVIFAKMPGLESIELKEAVNFKAR